MKISTTLLCTLAIAGFTFAETPAAPAAAKTEVAAPKAEKKHVKKHKKVVKADSAAATK